MGDEVKALIEKARNHKMTPAERFEQRVSFVYSGVCEPTTREQVRARLAEEYGDPVAYEARIAELEGELAAVRAALQVFGGDAAIEAKRLFERMMATPKHTPERKELAALHCEASKRAAMARRALAQQEPTP
jgi:hypothetical protein